MNQLSLCVFRSSDPALLTAWQQMELAAVAHQGATVHLLTELGFPGDHPVWVRNDHPGQKVVGFGVPDAGVPEGWRLVREYGDQMVPKRTTKLGKAIQIKVDTIGIRPDGRSVIKDFGMPMQVFAGLSLMSPGVARQGDDVWVKWSQDPRANGGPHNEVDMDIWTHVVLSEFVLLVEAGNDPWKGGE
jgi:hypothetical protein